MNCRPYPSIYPINKSIIIDRNRDGSPRRRTVHQAVLRAFITARCPSDAGITPLTMRFGITNPGNLQSPPPRKNIKIADGKVHEVQYTTPHRDLDCVPGRRNYQVDAKLLVALSKSGTVAGTYVYGGEQHGCNLSGAWQYRSSTSSTPRRPSAVLAANMANGQRPERRPGPGYAAHHIIPTYLNSRDARAVEAVGYKCRIQPNEAANGVYIRRAVHDRIHNDRHWRWMRRKFRPALGANGYCNYAKARSILDRIKGLIRAGDAGQMGAGGRGPDPSAD